MSQLTNRASESDESGSKDEQFSGTLVCSILDAGGDIDAVLSGLLYRQMASLDLGQVLEVISHNPRSRLDVAAWCRRSGHKMQEMAEEANETVFWIRKSTG